MLAGCGGDDASRAGAAGVDAGPETAARPSPDTDASTHEDAGRPQPTLAPPTCTRLLAARKSLQNLLNRCCSADELATQLAAYEDMIATCNKSLEKSLVRMSVDNTALAACAGAEEARYGALACTDLRGVRDILASELREDAKSAPECQVAYKGAGTMGASCGSPIECQDGLSCAGYVIDPATGEVVTQGACAAPAAVGKSCGPLYNPSGTFVSKAVFGGDHQDCVAGARCQRGSCVVREALDGACVQDGDCIEGARCQASVCANKPRSAEGGACSRGTDCVAASPALFCEIAAGAGTGTCRQTKPAGASCKNNECSGACTSEVCTSVCGSR